MSHDPRAQDSYGVRFEWGPAGADRVGRPGGALVVVDVLSFTTAVSVAVERGNAVLPAATRDDGAAALARRAGAELAVGRDDVTAEHPWSLSPATLWSAPAPARLVLPSPNGSAIAATASGTVLAGCLRADACCGRSGWCHHVGGRRLCGRRLVLNVTYL